VKGGFGAAKAGGSIPKTVEIADRIREKSQLTRGNESAKRSKRDEGDSVTWEIGGRKRPVKWCKPASGQTMY